MNEPVVPPSSPLYPAETGASGVIDDDASLTVDQVSEDPPEANLILASPCRDAIAQSAPCPLMTAPRAPGASPAPPRASTSPRASAPPRSAPGRVGGPASIAGRAAGPASVAPSVAGRSSPARLTPRPAKATTGARVATRSTGLAKGEMASLDGAGISSGELLAESCGERGPRLVVSSRHPDAIDPEAVGSIDEAQASHALHTGDSIDAPDAPDSIDLTDSIGSVDVQISEAPPVLVPTPSIPVVVSELPPRAGLTPAPASTRRPARPTPPPAPVATPAPTSVSGAALRAPGKPPARPPTPPPPASRPATTPAGVVPRPIGLISDFEEPPALDPLQALDVPLRPPPVRARNHPHPKALALFAALASVGALVVVALLFRPDSKGNVTAVASGSARALARPPASSEPRASASARPAEPPPDPGPWRVAALSSEEGVKMINGKLGTKSLMVALEEEHVPKPQIFRILKAFDDAKVFDKPRKSHQYTVALDRASKRVRGFEYQASATEVWQAREVDERLVGAKLDLKIEQHKLAKAVVVGDSLKSSLVEAGLDDDMMALLDEAISDRISLERIGKGSTLRVVAQEQLVAGRFSKYLSLDAVELRQGRAEGKRTRLYHFRNGKVSGVFDANGKAPMRSSWGPPLKVVRVTSRFNPKRLHPVLHTVMPHNGTDFGAPMGTPTYAVAAGTVTHVGPHGPSGNLVLVEHANGLESGYAHLSRFAPNLKKGDKVEAQQLVGFVGSTGRSTGPHLHFSIKKNGVYIDALTIIKLNQERVIPKAERDGFDAFKSEMDKLLDGVTMPDQAPPGDNAPDPDEAEPRDENNHGEEEDNAAPSGSPAAAAPPAGSDKAEPPAAAPVTDQTTPESAVWRPD